jgi:hypothetical protein
LLPVAEKESVGLFLIVVSNLPDGCHLYCLSMDGLTGEPE